MTASRRLLSALQLALAGLAACGAESPPPRPDVVIVVIDTLRQDVVFGSELGPRWAPELNTLFEDALVFDNAWSTSTWTAPSTASLFTGLYPDQHRVETGLRAHREDVLDAAQRTGEGQPDALVSAEGPARIPGDAETLATFLSRLGYRTLGVAANPNIGERLGFTRGFDRFETLDEGTADDIAGVVRGWREDLADDAPVFLYLHFMEPHAPYEERAPWFEDPGPNTDDDPFARERAAYLSEVRWLDARVAALLAELGGVQDALFFFAADHGEEFGEHGGLGHLSRLYAELMRVPLVMRLPGPEPPRGRSAEPVSLLDVLPTVRDSLGAPPDSVSPGRSLLSLAEGGTFGERTLFGMRRWKHGRLKRVAVQAGGYSLISTPHLATLELYDLAADPGQQHDLAAKEPERIARMLALLKEYKSRRFRYPEELGPAIALSEEEVALLEKLGYAGEE